MIFILAVFISIVIALLRGGRFERLGDINLRYAPLILLGFLIQLLIFTPILGPHLSQTQTSVVYNISMLLVLGVMALNWRLPGVPLLALGIFLNWVAISLNGGFMPSSQEALIAAGLADRAAMGEGEHFNNTVLVNESTRLPFLADVMAVPTPFPFATVFSIGDVLIAAGAAWLVQGAMVTPPEAAQVRTPTA